MADIDLRQGQSLPEGTLTRYQDQLDGTHALAVALGALGNTVIVGRVNPGTEPTDLGKEEGALYAAGHVGVGALGVRNDTDAVMPVVDGAYGFFTVDDTGRMRVAIASGGGVRINQTPTITAGAYIAKDAVGGLLTFANAARTSGGSGIINTLSIIDDDDEQAALELWLFNQTFTNTADNAPFDPSNADLENCVGVIPIAAADYFSANDNGVATLRGVGFQFTLTGTSLFGQLKCTGAPTYTATTDLTVSLNIEYLD